MDFADQENIRGKFQNPNPKHQINSKAPNANSMGLSKVERRRNPRGAIHASVDRAGLSSARRGCGFTRPKIITRSRRSGDTTPYLPGFKFLVPGSWFLGRYW